MRARAAWFAALVLMWVMTPASAQSQTSISTGGGFSIGQGGHFATYTWENGDHQKGDTLHFRVVQINTSSEPRVPDISCEIMVETDLDLIPVEENCSVGAAPLAPGDSVWTWRTAVIESSPGEYALAWGLEGRTFNSRTVRVRKERLVQNADSVGGRIPYVLELVGEESALHSETEIETVAYGALSHGARGRYPVIFRVDEEAARRMQEFTPVLRLTFEFREGGEVSLRRCWEGAPSTSLLSHLCGTAGKAGFLSEIGLGAWIHQMLFREGEYLADYGP